MSAYLSVRPSICISVRLSTYKPVCLSVRLSPSVPISVCVSVCRSTGNLLSVKKNVCLCFLCFFLLPSYLSVSLLSGFFLPTCLFIPLCDFLCVRVYQFVKLHICLSVCQHVYCSCLLICPSFSDRLPIRPYRDTYHAVIEPA